MTLYSKLAAPRALQGELATIEKATAELVAEMEQSIAEADRFIESME